MALTFSDLVTKIADIDRRDRDQVHTQIRNPAIRAHLVPLPGERGRTTAITYDEREVARARVFLALMDIGYDARLIAAVADALRQPPKMGLNHPPSAKVDGTFFYPPAFESAIRGMSKGETWDLSIRFTRAPDGTRDVQVRVLWDGWSDIYHDAASALFDEMSGHTLLGELRLPLTDIVRPLLPNAQ